MGKQAKVRHLRRHLKWRVAVGAASPTAAESAYRRARGRRGLPPVELEPPVLRGVRCEDEAATFTAEQLAELAARVHAAAAPSAVELASADQASNFYVGMSFSGPPEAFGLPPDPPGLPPSKPCVVTAVDYETGTITLTSAAP